MVILGIDPGLNATGYGAITVDGRALRVVTAGDIRPPHQRPLPERLEFLHRALDELISRQHPDAVVLESIFTHQSYINTAAKMGHARGMACLAAQEHRVPLIEYPPARVKKAVTGRGAATKDQVARMVAQWIGRRVDAAWSFDATDALALAIAHVHMTKMRSAEYSKCGVGSGECGMKARIQHSELRTPNSELSMGLGVEI